jgi:hypothetical protein
MVRARDPKEGSGHHLCEAPSGSLGRMVPYPFFGSRIARIGLTSAGTWGLWLPGILVGIVIVQAGAIGECFQGAA